MHTGRDRKNGEGKSRSGFTIAELMVATTLFLVVGGIAMSSVLALMGGSTRLAEYVLMNNTSHRVLETFARDIRMANDVIDHPTKHTLNFTRPNWDDPTVHDTIRYRFVPEERALFRRINEEPERAILNNLEDFELRCFNILRNPTTHRLEVKEVQIDAVMARRIVSTRVSNHIISARFMMRNKRVAE